MGGARSPGFFFCRPKICRKDAKFPVFVAAQAHPLPTTENCYEPNPHLTGNSTAEFIESRFFFPTPVGMGEDILGHLNFDLAHNAKNFFFLKIRKSYKDLSNINMFAKPTPVEFKNYKGPKITHTGSEILDQYVLASVLRGQEIF